MKSNNAGVVAVHTNMDENASTRGSDSKRVRLAKIDMLGKTQLSASTEHSGSNLVIILQISSTEYKLASVRCILVVKRERW